MQQPALVKIKQEGGPKRGKRTGSATQGPFFKKKENLRRGLAVHKRIGRARQRKTCAGKQINDKKSSLGLRILQKAGIRSDGGLGFPKSEGRLQGKANIVSAGENCSGFS